MDIFFLIVVKFQDQVVKYGPYITFQEATEILLESLPMLLKADGYNTTAYTVELHQMTPYESTWVTIDICINAEEKYEFDS